RPPAFPLAERVHRGACVPLDAGNVVGALAGIAALSGRGPARSSRGAAATAPRIRRRRSGWRGTRVLRSPARSPVRPPFLRSSLMFPPEPPGPEEPRRCYRSLWPGGLRLELGPGVPEAEGAVEDEPSGRRVGIGAEVAEALELHGLTDRQFRERRLDQALLEHRLRVGVEVGVEVAVSAGIGA